MVEALTGARQQAERRKRMFGRRRKPADYTLHVSSSSGARVQVREVLGV